MEILLFFDIDSAGDIPGAGQRGMAARNTVHERKIRPRLPAALKPLQSWEKFFCDSEYPQGVEMSVDLDMPRKNLQEEIFGHKMLLSLCEVSCNILYCLPIFSTRHHK